MIGYAEDSVANSFTLRSDISDLPRMRLWLDSLIQSNSITRKTAFSIRIALEEALSNIIRHGYNNLSDQTITIVFHLLSSTHHRFIIEDSAPHFSPLDVLPANAQSLAPDGRGLSILRNYATSLTYEQLPTGNRLTLVFTD